MRRILLVLTALLLGARAGAFSLPERRRDQFLGDPGRVLTPYAYHLPGIGWGYGVLGALTNVGGGHADFAGTFFFGDADGQAASVDQVHLVPRRLVLDAGFAHLSRASFQSYSFRGMDAGQDEYSLAEFGGMWFAGSRLTATADERRFEAFAGYYMGRAELKALRERDGTVITPATASRSYELATVILGLRGDLTDDAMDPRRGARLEPSLWRSNRRGNGPEYYHLDWALTAYAPVGRRSTWAFHLMRSDAFVLAKGETDPAALARDAGVDCAAVPDPARRDQCRRYLDTLAAQNAYGTATMLGGFNRLRAYPEGRFRGAHAELAGTELRWNLTDEERPFDVYLVKDIRTAVQVAFFYEAGTVADSRGQLWRKVRHAAGTGVRIVTASGLVYRLDLGKGDEGWQPSVFFQYPWEL
ncbi:MAG: hypothetical protein SF051_08825 [Elusimicrobiota bacterium]|nr:hypothetical protein [Elusimicrobiota bacterium]